MEQLKSRNLAVTGSGIHTAPQPTTVHALPLKHNVSRRAAARDSGCPMDALLRLLMGPWTTYILWLLQSNGPMRFGELKKQMPGISAKMLTERLRMLEEARVVYREQESTIPPKVTYGFTDRGRELKKVLGSLDALARQWTSES